MAKKKKKYFIKLNNKIRNYFNGLPFDEGVVTLDEDKLIELIMLLEIILPSHTKEDMIRALRRVWSEGEAVSREMIVSYLTQSYKAVPYAGHIKRPLDRWSSETVSLAIFQGRRRGSGVMSAPNLTVEVFIAMAVNAIQGSTTGVGQARLM